MITFDRIVMMVFLAAVFLYTISFGSWNWKKKNKLGAVVVYILAVATIGLPLYTIFFRN